MSWGSPCSGKNGCWSRKVYFDPEADLAEGSSYYISDSELRTKFWELINTDDIIEYISYYKNSLWRSQWTQLLFFHAFIVIESKKWYWSIEKNAQGITIQRSRYLRFVRDKYRRENRIDVNRSSTHSGKGTMGDLVNWLYTNDELNRGYYADMYVHNCQGFAGRVLAKFKA